MTHEGDATYRSTIAAHSSVSESWHGDKLVTREEGNFTDTVHPQFGGKVEAFPGQMTPLLEEITAFRRLDFTKRARKTVDVWLGFSIYWPVEIKVEKGTTIDVPAGKFDACQARMRPSFSQINGLLDKELLQLLAVE